MEHLEKLLPLAVVLGVAAFLVALLRRAMRENRVAEPPKKVAVKLEPVVVPAGAAPPKIEATLPTPAPVEIVPAGPAPLKSPKAAKPNSVIPLAATKTPIHGVLDLLREKDALVSAFLLREILGPPVSKRRP